MKTKKLSYHHVGGSDSLLGDTISNRFANIAQKFPTNTAVISQQQHTSLSYKQLHNRVKILAKGLLALGYKRSSRIGVWSTNNIEWLLIQMATAQIGAILVNINPANRQSELEYSLKRSQVEGLFVIPEFKSSHYLEILVSLIPELKNNLPSEIQNQNLPFLKHCIVFNPTDPLHTRCNYPGFLLWQDLLNNGESISDPDLEAITTSLDMDDPINIQYTSGTTGFPKPVVLTHHNLLNNAYFTAKAMHFSEQDRLCVPVPFYHCFGMVLANLMCFSVGATIVIPAQHFDPQATLQAIDEHQCSAVHGVPTMFIAQLEHPQFDEYNLTSLRTGIMAGAPCPVELMKRVMDEMHCPEILIGYGQTEVSPLSHLTDRQDSLERRTETVGINLPHQEVKVINTETGKLAAIGAVGEICFRGYHIMRGYYQDVEATEKTIDRAGWLKSGDLGTMDEHGYIRITGRLKEMVIRGGENIYPAEIEEVIFNHPNVEQVAVFGIPDLYFGEELMAWVLVKQGQSLSEQELREYCKDKLAHFKIPKHLWFVDEFPMTVTGKLQKFRMREIALDKLGITKP